MNKKLIFGFLVVIILIGVAYAQRSNLAAVPFLPNKTTLPNGVVSQQESKKDIEVIAEGLDIPWEIAFLPNGELLVTQRSGSIVKIGADKSVIEVQGVTHIGEGGLLGMTLHPQFEENNWVYIYLTSTQADGELINRVERYNFSGQELTERTTIIDEIPGSRFHDGGRIEFGPDGYLYISTGDAGKADEAQNTQTLHGTILRVTDEGLIPADNPFGNAVYSYGHRNVQGLAWDNSGMLWATEHGRSGATSGFDEINVIVAANNYGWPTIEGDEKQEGMRNPVLHSGADETWAPADVEIIGDKMFFTGLRGEALYEATIRGELLVNVQMHFREEFGRLRAVRVGPDGHLYLSTSNTDGRGEPKEGDDKIIRVNPALFE